MSEYESLIRKEKLSHADQVRLAELRIASDKRPKTEWTVEPIPENQTLGYSLDEIEKLGVGMTKLTDEQLKGLKRLMEPFDKSEISKLPKPTKAQTEEVKKDFKKGIRCEVCGGWHHRNVVHLNYVGHAALTKRLLEVDPLWNWEPFAVNEIGEPCLDNFGGMWGWLTVCGVTRRGYGDAEGKTGSNANKERIGDFLRNAAMRFGAALDLWSKADLTKLDIDDDTPSEQAPKENEEELLTKAIAWIDGFAEKKAPVAEFDEKIKKSSGKFKVFSPDNRQTIDAQIHAVREYLDELGQEQEKPEVNMEI